MRARTKASGITRNLPKQTPVTKPTQSRASRIPDFKWINKNLSVSEVGKALGLSSGSNGLIHCWHPERHHNGDRTASVGVRTVNNTVKCFGCACDVGPFGPIDLVMDVLGMDSPSAAGAWIVEHFEVPFLPKGKHLKEASRPSRGRVGFEGYVGLLVQSGLWGRLSFPARSLIPTLLEFAQKDESKPTYRVEISYRAISRYSGVKSHNAVVKALRELKQIHWLRWEQSPSPTVLRATNVYILTPESDELRELANAMARQTKDEVNTERELRLRQRSERLRMPTFTRKQSWPQAFTKYKTLYSGNTVERINAIRRIPRTLCAYRFVGVRTCRKLGSFGSKLEVRY
jgi:hypothetical protein